MKIKYIVSSLFVSALFLAPLGVAQAQQTEVEGLLKQLQSLQQQVESLQSQIKQTKKQVREPLNAELREGVRNDDVRKVQEVLSTDEAIYPEKLVTGYYGPLTKAAVRRLQQRFDLPVTGDVNEDTRQYLEELLQDKFGDRVPPGLLKAPGIQKKVEVRIKNRCDQPTSVLSTTKTQFCQKVRAKVQKHDSDSIKKKNVSDIVSFPPGTEDNGFGTGSGRNSLCPADTNFDGEVDGRDLDNVNKLWGTDGQKGTVDADVNGDGVVTFDDLLLVLSGWGTCDVDDDSLDDDGVTTN
jgi:hypothetical protein